MDEFFPISTRNPLSSLVSAYMMTCPGGNCSGHGECMNGTCFCEIQFDGEECHAPNMPYYIGFATVFFFLGFVCFVQLITCVVAEYYRMKSPSVLRACRVTTQKLLYFVVFLAAIIRGAYFTSPTAFQEGWSSSLMSAYYPLLLSSSSLIVCLWAEVFHLRDIRWDRPQFLSKSFLGFVTFNILTYSLLAAEFITTKVSTTPEKKLLQQHIFNGCYAVLLFIVVVFFLIYGVEVFFKVRGGFLVDPVSNIANRAPLDEKNSHGNASIKLCSTASMRVETGVDVSQLHQSRLGLVSQACMLIIVVGFLFSETLGEFWKEKAPIHTRNWHDVTFRILEIGVVLWFPCVLWNCMSPDQLWILNPKKLLKRVEHPDEAGSSRQVTERKEVTDDGVETLLVDCWICYDPERSDAGPLIQPCKCSGDVSSVHHNCLRRWLVESSSESKDGLSCKVCKTPYEVTRSNKLDWQMGFTSQHCLRTTVIVTVMCVAGASAWAIIQLFGDPYIRMIAASTALLVIYVCVRFLGVNTAEAYQRARVSGMNIKGNVATVSECVPAGKKMSIALEEVHASCSRAI